MSNILTISKISKKFENLVVLDDVNLSFEKGDIYGILGLSGAGKSTLVRCINGLEVPTHGEIIFNNKVISSPTIKIQREDRKKISMIFQTFNLLNQKNVIKNIDLALYFSSSKRMRDYTSENEEIKKIKKQYKLDKKNASSKEEKKMLYINYKKSIAKIKYKKAFELLEKVGLEDKWDAYPSQLSGGQKQRVAIARSLMNDPEILLCDEATSALDPETTASILELLKSLNKQLNLTIIIISHQMNVIESICNKVAVISNAKIVENGLLSEIFLNPKTEITKKLIYSDKVSTKLSSSNFIRVIFDGNVDEPLIANIVQECNILVSIVHADTKVIQDKVYGQMVFKLPYHKKDIEKLKTYLNYKNIKYEEVNEDEFNNN